MEGSGGVVWKVIATLLDSHLLPLVFFQSSLVKGIYELFTTV